MRRTFPIRPMPDDVPESSPGRLRSPPGFERFTGITLGIVTLLDPGAAAAIGAKPAHGAEASRTARKPAAVAAQCVQFSIRP
jgi:hypothetical protein